MRLVSFVLLAATVGCSKMATVPVNLSAAGDQVTAIAQRIELKHEEDGWKAVGVNVGDKKVQRMAAGNAVPVATVTIPKGKYTAVKAVFMAPGKDSTKGFGMGDRPSGNQNKGMVEYTAKTKTEFCVKGKKDNDVTINVRQATANDEPSIKVGQRPACK